MPTDAMRICADNCLACYRACSGTAARCLDDGGPHAVASHLGLLADCAEACRFAADLLLRGSPRHHLACAACGELSDQAAADCEQLGESECAAACRACAATCRELAAAASLIPAPAD